MSIDSGKKRKDTLNFSTEGTILIWFLRQWHWTKKAILVAGRPLTECVFQVFYKCKIATRVCSGVVESPERTPQMSSFRTAGSFPPSPKESSESTLQTELKALGSLDFGNLGSLKNPAGSSFAWSVFFANPTTEMAQSRQSDCGSWE